MLRFLKIVGLLFAFLSFLWVSFAFFLLVTSKVKGASLISRLTGARVKHVELRVFPFSSGLKFKAQDIFFDFTDVKVRILNLLFDGRRIFADGVSVVAEGSGGGISFEKVSAELCRVYPRVASFLARLDNFLYRTLKAKKISFDIKGHIFAHGREGSFELSGYFTWPLKVSGVFLSDGVTVKADILASESPSVTLSFEGRELLRGKVTGSFFVCDKVNFARAEFDVGFPNSNFSVFGFQSGKAGGEAVFLRNDSVSFALRGKVERPLLFLDGKPALAQKVLKFDFRGKYVLKTSEFEFEGNFDIDAGEVSFSGRADRDELYVSFFSDKLSLDMLGLADFEGDAEISANLFAHLGEGGTARVEASVRVERFSIGRVVSPDSVYATVKVEPPYAFVDAVVFEAGERFFWKGKIDLAKGKIESEADLRNVALSTVMSLLGVSLDRVDALLDTRAKLDVDFDGYAFVFADVRASDIDVLGERFSCSDFSLSATASFDGDVKLWVQGTAWDSAVCISLPEKNSTDFSLSLKNDRVKVIFFSRKLELSDVDIFPYFAGGVARVEGSVLYHRGVSADISFFANDVVFEVSGLPFQKPLSCAWGDVIVRHGVEGEKIAVRGKTCEGFVFDINVFPPYSLASIEGKIYGNLITATISGGYISVEGAIPDFLGPRGKVVFKYDLERGVGRGWFILDNFEDFSATKVNLTISLPKVFFEATGRWRNIPFRTKGYLDGDSIVADIEVKEILGVPVNSRARVRGTTKSIFIRASAEVKETVIDAEKINQIIETFSRGGGGKVSVELTSNILIDIRNVIFEEEFAKLVLNGKIFVTTSAGGTSVGGSLSVDGGTLFVLDRFENVRGKIMISGTNAYINLSGHKRVYSTDGIPYDIRVSVVGDVKNPVVSFSSSPPLSPEDTICMLTFRAECGEGGGIAEALANLTFRNINIFVSQTPIGQYLSPEGFIITRNIGKLSFTYKRNIFEGVNELSVRYPIFGRLSLLLTWDDRRYGLSNFGNAGMDILISGRF